MANWCNNYAMISLNTKTEDCEKFLKDLGRVKIIADYKDKVKSQMFTLAKGMYMDIQDIDLGKFPETLSDNVYVFFETKWAPLDPEVFVRICEKYKCIESINISYDEPNCEVGGEDVINKDSKGIVSLKRYQATEDYWVLENMRGDEECITIEDYSESVGKSVEELEKILKRNKYTVEDFNSYMEPIDMDNYLMSVIL